MQGPLTALLSTDEPTVTQSVERALPKARPLVVCVTAIGTPVATRAAETSAETRGASSTHAAADASADAGPLGGDPDGAGRDGDPDGAGRDGDPDGAGQGGDPDGTGRDGDPIPVQAVIDGLGVAIVAANAVPDAPGIGVGDAFTDLRDARRSFRHARAALNASGGKGGRWQDLRADRLLATLPPTALEDLPATILTLLADARLARTLAAYLDHAGDLAQTAAALTIDRVALDARLDTIESLAHVDLHNGEDRLLCHVALRLSGTRR